MERRNFIKNTGLAAAGVLAVPYILPSGKLFAATGSRKVNHVVLCMIAGGIRTNESIHKAEGNLMPNMLKGDESISEDLRYSITKLPIQAASPLQNYGTLYKHFRYVDGPVGHFNAHAAMLTGKYYKEELNHNLPPSSPTLFEYYRKHQSTLNSSLNSWFIGNPIGAYPSLGFSTHQDYGYQYNANWLGSNLFRDFGNNLRSNTEEFKNKDSFRADLSNAFFQKNFKRANFRENRIFSGQAKDSTQLDDFFKENISEAINTPDYNPWNLQSSIMNNDMYNVHVAEKVLQAFLPELLVVNMQEMDMAHSNFSQYCNNINKADYALAHLWSTIQNTPSLADDTLLIALPDHGRNSFSNSIVDSNGRYGIDHSDNEKSRESFCLVMGPEHVVKQNQQIEKISGETIDVLPTIADALGFYTDIDSGMLSGRVLNEAFV